MINVSQLKVGWSAMQELLPGDVVSVRTPGAWMSDMTRQFERSPGEDPAWATHSGVMDAVANGQQEIIEALWHVTRRPLTAYLGKSLVAVARCPMITFNARLRIAEEARRHLGQKYGWWDLLLHIIGRAKDIRDPNRPICSYLVAYAYDVGASVRFGKPPNECQPDDLLDFAIYNNWPLVWANSHETVDQLHAIYGDSGESAEDLAARHGFGKGGA